MDAEAQAQTTHAARLPLVGRDAALAGIHAALDRARASLGELVLITGEAGIGKTRLAAEVFNSAPGFMTVWSWCASDPAGSSFRPWLQVVQELAAADTEVARVAAASPQLAGLISHAGPLGDALGTDETIRWQLFDAVVTVLRTAAASTPVLIVLDDLHAAQESSMWLLAHLAAGLRSSPVLMLATARDGEHAWHGHVEARAAILRQVTSVHLLPLSEQQVGELIAHVNTDIPGRSVLASRIHARTGGNPLLVSELLRPQGAQPLLEASGVSAFGAAVPASVRAITAERLVGCSSACQRLVAVAAVLGTRFDLDALADVVEMDLGTAREILVDAESIGVLEFPEPGGGRFVHELIRDAVYDRLSSAERCRWHERAASVLANFARRGRSITPAEMAHHWLLAGPHVASEAAELAQLAGDRAAEVLAFEDAVAWYERALATAQPAPCSCGGQCETASASASTAPERIAAGRPERIEMDRAGYFVVIPDPKRQVVLVEHCTYDNRLQHVVEGTDSRSLCSTIIDKGWVTQLSHAAYLGRELARAELSLQRNFKFVQDSD